MATKIAKTKEVFDRTEFTGLLSTLSLDDVLTLEFRIENIKKWESMVICKDHQKKMYLCNVCKVFQYGDKNLFSHLGGKKHCSKMESVEQVRLLKENVKKITTRKCISEEKNIENKSSNKNDPSSSMFDSKKKAPFSIQQNKQRSASKAIALKPVSKQTVIAKAIKSSKEEPVLTRKSNASKEKSVPTPKLIKPKEMIDSIKIKNISEKESKKETNFQSYIEKKANDQSNERISQVSLENLDTERTQPVNMLNILSENIVINPLSQEKKISCVPISKLTNNEPTDLENKNIGGNDDDMVQFVSEISLKGIEICKHKEDKPKEKQIATENSISKNLHFQDNANFNPILSEFQSSAFECTTNTIEITGVIGVEYVIKIIKNVNDRIPKFLCSLCNISTDEISMQKHLISYNHRLKYCEKHFPTAIRQYKQYISHIPEHQVYKVFAPILEKLAVAIERHHGRDTAYLCYEYSFTKHKQSIISTVYNRRHASEVLGPTFTHVVDSNEVDLLIQNASNKNYQSICGKVLNKIDTFNTFNNPTDMFQNPFAVTNYSNRSSINETNKIEAVDDETHKRMVDIFLRDTRKSQPLRHRHSSQICKRDRSRSNSPHRKRKRSNSVLISQWNIERRSLSPLRDGDIWQAYRHMVDQNIRDLNTTYDLYKSDPEEHPLYNEEWQKFWKRRKDELISAGINHRTYNYQNEWILFFNARLEELYNQDVENIKIKCRERLCLPMTNNELSDLKYHVHVSDKDSDFISPKEYENNSDNQAKYNDTDSINVIHVLRLLTALEDYLGSLGPNITELLAKALQMIKLHPENINNLILTSENCAILETAKEKFTGLIISKILDPVQERALKKAINDTNMLLSYASNVKLNSNERFQSTSEQKKSYSFSSKKTEYKNKTELAAKLASTLISQGKTRLNEDQLKQIVQVYSLIEEKKHQDTPLATRADSTSLNCASLGSMYQPNKAPNISVNDLTFQGCTPDNLELNKPLLNQTENCNYSSNRFTFAKHFQYTNSSMISDVNNIKTSCNYSSENMARTNNINNKNPNEIEYSCNSQDSHNNHYDFEEVDNTVKSTTHVNDGLTNRRNFTSVCMSNNYSFESTYNNVGGKPNWI